MTIHACVDCIHYLAPCVPGLPIKTHSRCGHEFEIDLVTGERNYKFCDLVRKVGACGSEGRYFEPKQDPRYQEFDDHEGEPIDPARPF